MSILGIGLTLFAELGNKSIISLLSYIFIFIVIPAYGAYGLWKRSLCGVFVSLVFSLSQSVKLIGGSNWLPFNPPLSLGISMGSFENGSGYFIDFLAITMAIFLISLLQSTFNSKKSLSRGKK
jgi:hypothetical protein